MRKTDTPVALWDAWLPAGDWAWLLGYERHQSRAGDTVPLRGSLEDFARMVRR